MELQLKVHFRAERNAGVGFRLLAEHFPNSFERSEALTGKEPAEESPGGP
jgi:hypothetical protein